MTPPKASDQGTAIASDTASAVLLCDASPLQASPLHDSPFQASPPIEKQIETLTRRADFLRASSAKRMGTGSFLLQARARGDATATIRIGFTASKKIGNAVARNRAKRRMRAVVRAVLPKMGIAGWDYVLVAKPGATIARDFADLLADLTRAMRQIHAEGQQNSKDLPNNSGPALQQGLAK